MRVLHVVESLDTGAVENWLIRMLRFAVATGHHLDWTFYCSLPQPGLLDSMARDLGANVVQSPVPIGQTSAFIWALRTELKRGRYDVLHCHHDLMSAVYLLAALCLRLQARIVHVHNADEAILTPHRRKAAFVRWVFRKVCLLLADQIVAVSEHTLRTFSRGRRRRSRRDRVHYYGIDVPTGGGKVPNGAGFRQALELPPDALLLLFAGRLVPEKNPVFAVEVLAKMIDLDGRVAGVFVGEGSELSAVVTRAGELEICDRLRTLGWKKDVLQIMACCDWFILPRPETPMEGFGIAVVEAQVSGLRLLLSCGIADDPLLPTACFTRLPLAAGADAWALAAFQLLKRECASREEAVLSLRESPFDMQFALRELLKLHQPAHQYER